MILVVIPAYNEAEPLQELLALMPSTLHGLRIDPLVVSDGSTDATGTIAVAGGARLIELARNRGKTNAVRIALESFSPDRHEAAIIMDADGQHRPEDLETLVEPILHHSIDMVVGSRYLTDTSRGCTPLNRYAVRSATVSLLSRIWGLDLTDPYSGYRALSQRCVEVLTLEGDRYECELEMTFACAENGLAIREIPIEKRYPANASKMGADRGRLLGRITVVLGYARTMIRAAWRTGIVARTRTRMQWS